MSSQPTADALLLLLMRASSATAERVNAEVVAAGHPHLRPAHGLVFVRIARDGASVSEIASYLGVTKQSAGAIVDQLVASGYAEKEPDPRDRRAQVVRLTERGAEVTRLAAAAVAAEWERVQTALGVGAAAALAEGLELLARGGSPRPVW